MLLKLRQFTQFKDIKKQPYIITYKIGYVGFI